jgi:hypothetical protein
MEMAAHLGAVKLFQAAKNSEIKNHIIFLPNRNSGSAKSTGQNVRKFLTETKFIKNIYLVLFCI